eukprot:scaffold1901_cov236-Pinguiococcus_pyrenoidosus.AAC.6
MKPKRRSSRPSRFLRGLRDVRYTGSRNGRSMGHAYVASTFNVCERLEGGQQEQVKSAEVMIPGSIVTAFANAFSLPSAGSLVLASRLGLRKLPSWML